VAAPHVGELPEGTKPCRACWEPINQHASKCIHCGSEQGWRARLAIGSTTLSLLVALFSVLTVAIPVSVSMLTPKNSKLAFSPQGLTKTNVSVLVSNNGVRAGSVRSGSLHLDSYTVQLHIGGMEKNEPKIVEPGKSELVKLYAAGKTDPVGDPKKCWVEIKSVDFTGSGNDDSVDVGCDAARTFVMEHLPGAAGGN